MNYTQRLRAILQHILLLLLLAPLSLFPMNQDLLPARLQSPLFIVPLFLLRALLLLPPPLARRFRFYIDFLCHPLRLPPVYLSLLLKHLLLLPLIARQHPSLLIVYLLFCLRSVLVVHHLLAPQWTSLLLLFPLVLPLFPNKHDLPLLCYLMLHLPHFSPPRLVFQK